MTYSKSFLPSFRLSGHFLGTGSFFSVFKHDARNPYEDVRGRFRFFGIFFFQKVGEGGPKTGFLNLLIKFCHHFLLNLLDNGNYYYLLCSYTKLIFGKNHVLEMWAKMLSANQIAGFLNMQYLQNELMK